ncbi:MAG TPA: ATP-binding protein [Gammaproteobacteria bacterium]|nr:ATP-binding protein [Gammaproteobacteria bacterium]
MLKFNLIRTPTFRLTLLFAAVFGVITVVLFGFLYRLTIGSIARETDEVIIEQIQGLRDVYTRLGPQGLIDVINERTQDPTERDAIYLLADAKGTPLAGNLSKWPAEHLRPARWIEFGVDATEYGKTISHQARAHSFTLDNDLYLLVGQDIDQQRDFRDRMTMALGWGLALMLGLGLIGGALVSRNFLSSIERIVQVSQRITDGDLSRRVPVGGSGDALDRLAAHLNDMLERLENLMHGMRAISDGLAHNLRSPVTHLRNQIEWALNAARDTDDYRASLEQALTEADRLNSLFETLLDIARAESGAINLPFEDINLDALLRELIELYEPLAETRQQHIAFHGNPAVSIRGNRQLLAHCFANLIDNAIKYSPRAGQIGIHLGADGRPSARISDRGPGIPKAGRDMALQRFSRLSGSESVPGSGLGLSLVAAVAKLHRARLDLDDNAPGLRVTLTFPPG